MQVLWIICAVLADPPTPMQRFDPFLKEKVFGKKMVSEAYSG
jgi:hypothetical protein